MSPKPVPACLPRAPQARAGFQVASFLATRGAEVWPEWPCSGAGLAKLGKLPGTQGTLIASTKDFQASSTFFQPIKGSPGSLA
jgi:hypothetical protein